MERIVEQVSREQNRSLASIDTFVGGGAPRFWYSLAPESRHANYAQVVIALRDEHDTDLLLPGASDSPLARDHRSARSMSASSKQAPPSACRFRSVFRAKTSPALRANADRVKQILSDIPQAARVRDDWGEDRFALQLKVDPDRANLAGVTNLDVAHASAGGINGNQLTVLREGDKQIPVVSRLRPNERAQLDDVENLYVYSSSGTQKVPLGQVSSIDYSLQEEVIRRRNQFRTITVSASPRDGVLASEVMKRAAAGAGGFGFATCLPDTGWKSAARRRNSRMAFASLGIVLLISSAAIFLALAFQFKSAVKPFIVFAAVLTGLWAL